MSRQAELFRRFDQSEAAVEADTEIVFFHGPADAAPAKSPRLSAKPF